MGKITVETCEIEGLKIITPTVFGDNRGYFMETYNYNDFKEKLIDLLNDENKIMLLKNNALKKFSNFSTEEIKVLESRL